MGISNIGIGRIQEGLAHPRASRLRKTRHSLIGRVLISEVSDDPVSGRKPLGRSRFPKISRATGSRFAASTEGRTNLAHLMRLEGIEPLCAERPLCPKKCSREIHVQHPTAQPGYGVVRGSQRLPYVLLGPTHLSSRESTGAARLMER
jgi:hypothetical protein